MTPQEAADTVEIGQVIQRYGKALDTRDYDLLHTVFAPGASLRYEMDDGQMEAPFEKWLAIWPPFLLPFYWTSHTFSAPVVELAGDSATAHCRLTAQHVQIRRDDTRNLWTVYGFYRDTLSRTGDGWRITQRFFQGVHTEGSRLDPSEVKP